MVKLETRIVLGMELILLPDVFSVFCLKAFQQKLTAFFQITSALENKTTLIPQEI